MSAAGAGADSGTDSGAAAATPAASRGAFRLPVVALAACLAVLAAGGRLSWPALPSTWSWLEAPCPGLAADTGAPATAMFAAPAPPTRRNLPAAAVAATRERRHPDSSPPEAPHAPYLGLLPLLLAGHALLAGRFGRDEVARAPTPWTSSRLVRWGAALALGTLGVAVPWPGAFLAIAWALCLWGLAETCRPRAADEDARPALALGATSVVLAAALAGLALAAGSLSDRALLEPFLQRLDPSERPAWTPTLLAVNAAHLRAVLDRSALCALAGMLALLLHLKARRTATGMLLVAAVVADLASVVPG